MKRIFVLIVGMLGVLMFQTTVNSAPPTTGAASSPAAISGKVVETMDSGGYTYVQLEQEGEKIWVALPKTTVKKGQTVTVRPGMVMENFESKTLKRKFDRIVFSGGIIDDKPNVGGEKKSEGSKGNVPAAEKISVTKASGPDAYTIAEIYQKKKTLNGKSVSVKAKVVKVTTGIMKMNWVHLQDGSGKAADGTNDIVATSTADLPTTGDIVTVSGTLAADKDFGSGYKYAVLIENAIFKK